MRPPGPEGGAAAPEDSPAGASADLGAGSRAGAGGAARVREYARLMRLHRPIGAFLLLWPTLWALWIGAEGTPPPAILAVFVLGVWVMRSAGCVINDYADRRLDPQVERTRDRPLALGTVRPGEALLLFAVLMLVALGLVLTLNRQTIGLAAVAAVLAVVYPFLKRVTHLPQVWLGAAFGWGIPMGFAAVTGTVPPAGWALLLANVLWAVAYDTMYAMADRPDDVRAGSHSTAILFGRADRAMVAAFQAAALAVLAAIGWRLDFGLPWAAGLAAAACFGLYQQRLIRARDRQDCFRAFMNNNWLGGAVFLGLAAEYAMRADP